MTWTNRPPTEPAGPAESNTAAPESARHWYQEPGYPPAEREFDWRRHVTALLRYKWFVLAATVLGTVVGFVASRRVATLYEAQSTILIETSIGGEAGGGPIRPTGLLESQSWIDLLRTYLVLDHVVQDLRLYVRSAPEDSTLLSSLRVTEQFVPGDYRLAVGDDGERFTLLVEDIRILQRGEVGVDSVGPDLGFLWLPEALPAGRTVDFSLVSPRDIATSLADRLQTEMLRNGNFLRLSLRGQNPERTAATLNAVANRYVEVAQELKATKMSELTKILKEQLDYAAEQLKEAQGDFEGFRVRTATVPRNWTIPLAPGSEQNQDPAYGSYFSMKLDQDEIRRTREAIQHILDVVPDSGLKVEALEVLPKVKESSALSQALQDLTQKRVSLRELSYVFAEGHPDVRVLREQIGDLEQKTIPQLTRALIERLERDEANLAARIGSASSELREIPSVAIEEARLRGRMDAAEALYRRLQDSHEQARLAAANAVPDVRILDPAMVPRVPLSSTRRLGLIAFGFIGGIGVGVLGILLFDRFDPRLSYPDQVSKELGIPVIGLLPHIGNANSDVSAALEAFRGVRLNLVHTYGTAGPVLVTISSAGARDGKTFVSTNLALAFADLGPRTLVVDADIRRGTVHKRFNGIRIPGLTDYLMGQATWRQIIQPAAVGSVDFIASGTRIQRGPELLQSDAMSSLVARLRAEYDVILIDCSPLAAGVDPLVLGTLTGNLLLVIRTGETDRALLEHKLDLLEPLPIRLLGAVVNGVRASGVYRYYSYHYSSLPGYESHDEPAEVPPPALRRRLETNAGRRSQPDPEHPGPEARHPASAPEQPEPRPRDHGPEANRTRSQVWYPKPRTGGPDGAPASRNGPGDPASGRRNVEYRSPGTPGDAELDRPFETDSRQGVESERDAARKELSQLKLERFRRLQARHWT